mmetsp:Transcript_32653/g.85707  ORF Transcript_32653/g.85707 Transcript_32653/m.85707 type:complete len:281 (-) Transcript_32653:612-1454(-)
MVCSLRLLLVDRELVDAPIAVLDLVRHLNLELRHELVDYLLHLREAVDLRGGGDQGEPGGACVARRLPEQIGHPGTPAGLLARCTSLNERGALLDELLVLDETLGRLQEHLEGLVAVEDLDGVLHGGDLVQAALHPRLELRVPLRALLLQVREEGLVHGELILSVLELLHLLSVLLPQGSVFLVDLCHHLLAGRDLVQLGLLHGLKLLDRLLLVSLGIRQIRLEVYQHLLEDPEDLRALRRVASVARDGQEGHGVRAAARRGAADELPEHLNAILGHFAT